jgi:hypothetical protein
VSVRPCLVTAPLQVTLLLPHVVVPLARVQFVQAGLAVTSPPGDTEPALHTLQAGGVTPGVTSLPAGQAAKNTCSSGSSNEIFRSFAKTVHSSCIGNECWAGGLNLQATACCAYHTRAARVCALPVDGRDRFQAAAVYKQLRSSLDLQHCEVAITGRLYASNA